MQRLFLINLLLLSLFFISPTWADEFSCAAGKKSLERDVLARVDQSYRSTLAFKTNFVQFSYFIGLDESQESRGELKYQQVGKMNWHYLSPDIQDFVSNGETVWWYQPKENQVNITELKKAFNADVPLSFLLGVGKLSEDFKLIESCYADNNLILKLATIKQSDSLKEFYLLISKDNYFPLGAKIVDTAGNETKIIFSEVNVKAKFQPSDFEFIIPKGTDIIDRRVDDE